MAWLKRLRLVQKIALWLFVSNIILLALGMAFLYSSASREAVRMNARLQENNLHVARENIEALLERSESAAISIFFDQEMKDAVLGGAGLQADPALYNQLRGQLLSVLNTAPQLSALAILGRDGFGLYTGTLEQYPYADYQACLQYIAGLGMDESQIDTFSLWAYADGRGPDGRRGFINVRKLKNIYSREDEAVMAVYLKEQAVCDLYAFFGRESFLVSRAGVVLSAPDKDRLGQDVSHTPLFSQIAAQPPGEEFAGLAGDGMEYAAAFIPRLGAYLVAVPDATALTATQSAVSRTLMILLVLCPLFSLAAAIAVSHGLTRPIARLKRVMEQARQGDFSARYAGNGASDEISYLGGAFNTLMDAAQRHITEIECAEKEKRLSEARFLQAQINPHLLYNTLDSVLMYLDRNDTQQAGRVIALLSRFFRLSLGSGEDFVALQTELDHVRAYVQLQRLCRDKQVRLIERVPPELMEVTVVRTILQPIVENAFLHAFVGSVSDGTLTVEAHRSGGDLVLSVTDDGLGMSQEELYRTREAVLSGAVCKGERGFGLKNVNRRLKARYGSRYALLVESEFGEYTRVTLTLPLEGEKETCTE